MTPSEIVSKITNPHVVITGGEPTLYNLDEILKRLQYANAFTQLETSGQQALKGNLRPNWITWSPKQQLNWDAPNYYYWAANEIKWVVDDQLMWSTVYDNWLRCAAVRRDRIGTHLPYVSLMPEGCPPGKESTDKALQFLRAAHANGLIRPDHLWRYSDRIQWRIGVR